MSRLSYSVSSRTPDHKNLEYICTAKGRNSRRARWSLFFNRSTSASPTDLGRITSSPSHQFTEREESTTGSEPVLPAPCRVTTLTWEIEERVKSANENQPGPSACPPRLFVLAGPVIRRTRMGPRLQVELPSEDGEDVGPSPSTHLVPHFQRNLCPRSNVTCVPTSSLH